MADGPLEALRLVDALEEQLAAYRLWHATRADLLRRLDRADEAIVSQRRAHARAQNAVDRRYLERRLGQLTTSQRVVETQPLANVNPERARYISRPTSSAM